MEIRYNVTGVKRKELVKVIADATGARAEYKFMPTCNYEIDYFTVTKDGTLLFDDRADREDNFLLTRNFERRCMSAAWNIFPYI